MIVRERELVLVIPPDPRGVWLGDTTFTPGGAYSVLPDGEYFKVKHQLTCSECHVGVREQDDHHCSAPD